MLAAITCSKLIDTWTKCESSINMLYKVFNFLHLCCVYQLWLVQILNVGAMLNLTLLIISLCLSRRYLLNEKKYVKRVSAWAKGSNLLV